jgi:putative peptide zinc metalloprotease protein
MIGVNWNEMHITEIEDGRWIITTQNGIHFGANKNSVDVLVALKSCGNPNDAFAFFKSFSKSEISYEEFLDCSNRLSKAAVGKRDSYLTFKVPLFNARVCGILAKPFGFLFSHRLFWICFSLFFGVGVYTLFTASLTIEPNDYLKVLVLFYAGMFLHEIGHISACNHFNASPGGIGGGFYFIFPVLYADISNIWLLNKQKRVIVNLAGVFAELLFATVLLFLGHFQTDLGLIATAYLVIVRAFFSLNPFLRGDGYWVLSDLTSTANLLNKANNKLIDVFYRKSLSLKKRDWLLISYSIINTCLLVIIFAIVAFRHHEQIIAFPAYLVSWITNASDSVVISMPKGYDLLIIIAFYAFAFKFLIRLIKYLKQVKGIIGAVPGT